VTHALSLHDALPIYAARAARVARIVAASSHKACEPSSVLGTTKFLMERILCTGDEPVGIALRLGGVLGSTGSVLERWESTRANRSEEHTSELQSPYE